MKKIFNAIILSAAVMLAFGISAAAEEDIKVEVNKAQIEFDTPPVIKNERTLIPVRAVAEEMGLEVDWDDSIKTAYVRSEDTEVSLTIGSNIITINDDEQEMDIAPEIINERTLLPIRFIAEAFDAKVDWIQETQTVVIDSPEKKLLFNGTFKDGEMFYHYSDDYFEDVSGFDKKLAVLSSVGTLAADNERSINAYFEKNGFEDIKTFNYEKDSLSSDYTHKSDYAVARKKINGRVVVGVFVRGTYGNEWYSNFNILSTPDADGEIIHYGFKTAADEVMSTIREYAAPEDIIWINGHSRGAAVANISAAQLHKEGYNVIGYTFATPNVIKMGNEDATVNIYNFVSNDDFVTRIPLMGGDWNYTRNGVTIELNGYNLEEMNKLFTALTGKLYKKIMTDDVDNAINALKAASPNIDAYYNTEHSNMTTYEFFMNILAPLLNNQINVNLMINAAMDSYYQPILTFFIGHGGGEAAKDFAAAVALFGIKIEMSSYDDGNGIIYEHCPESYLSKIINTDFNVESEQ